MTFMANHISVSIERRAAEVYEFASNPENLPHWARTTQRFHKKARRLGYPFIAEWGR